MYRRRTVEALLRNHARREETLLAVIRDLNDRLMLLAGKQYAPTPAELAARPADTVEEDEPFDDLSQLPDDLGTPW